VEGSCKYGNEASGSIRDGALLEQLKDQYLQMDSAACTELRKNYKISNSGGIF
jgi:hypothetical protein